MHRDAAPLHFGMRLRRDGAAVNQQVNGEIAGETAQKIERAQPFARIGRPGDLFVDDENPGTTQT